MSTKPEIPSYFTRVSDFINDPIMPSNKLNPVDWARALWCALWSKWMYDEEQFREALRKSMEKHSSK